MDGPALTRRERLILESIEAELRQDTGLDRKLSTMRPSRAWHLPHPLRSWRERHRERGGDEQHDEQHREQHGEQQGDEPR